MANVLRHLGKRILSGTRLEAPVREFLRVRLSVRVVNFLFQRCLRINGSVRWPVHFTSIVECGERLEVGAGVPRYLANSGHCYIQAFNGIKIGAGTIFAPGVKLLSTNHDENDFGVSKKAPPIDIGKHCWIGANAVILPGVVLGDNVIVAAGAVVSKAVPPNVIVAGVPARVIRRVKGVLE